MANTLETTEAPTTNKRKRGPVARFTNGIVRTSVALTPELDGILRGYAAAHGVERSDALREAVARLGDNADKKPRAEVLGKG